MILEQIHAYNASPTVGLHPATSLDGDVPDDARIKLEDVGDNCDVVAFLSTLII